MRLFFTIFWIVLVFLILGLFVINVGQPVKVDLFFTEYEQVDIITIAFTMLFIGFVFGALLISFYLVREKKTQTGLKKQVKFLQEEMRKTESAPEMIDAEIVGDDEESNSDEEEKKK